MMGARFTLRRLCSCAHDSSRSQCHGFLRAQNHAQLAAANTGAAQAAWPRTIAFFRELLEQ